MSENEKIVSRLYDALRRGQDQLGRVLAQYSQDLNIEIANRCEKDFALAAERHDFGASLAASNIAMRAYNFIGRREDALNSLMDSYGILFCRIEHRS